jgi:hypothetical protein
LHCASLPSILLITAHSLTIFLGHYSPDNNDFAPSSRNLNSKNVIHKHKQLASCPAQERPR